MQWLIDIISEKVLKSFKGVIVAWSGTTADVPDGWAICDGTNGTPDLRAKFIYGTKTFPPPGSTGGSASHKHNFRGDGHLHKVSPHAHDFTTDGHRHRVTSGLAIEAGNDYDINTTESADSGTTETAEPTTNTSWAAGTTGLAEHRPPWYALCYIMKL